MDDEEEDVSREARSSTAYDKMHDLVYELSNARQNLGAAYKKVAAKVFGKKSREESQEQREQTTRAYPLLAAQYRQMHEQGFLDTSVPKEHFLASGRHKRRRKGVFRNRVSRMWQNKTLAIPEQAGGSRHKRTASLVSRASRASAGSHSTQHSRQRGHRRNHSFAAQSEVSEMSEETVSRDDVLHLSHLSPIPRVSLRRSSTKSPASPSSSLAPSPVASPQTGQRRLQLLPSGGRDSVPRKTKRTNTPPQCHRQTSITRSQASRTACPSPSGSTRRSLRHAIKHRRTPSGAQPRPRVADETADTHKVAAVATATAFSESLSDEVASKLTPRRRVCVCAPVLYCEG